jgi:hypothetical protein
MCQKCGCNTCETKIKGPLLTESKVKSLLSEGLQYHIDKKIPLFETVYRISSDKHLALIKEARKMYSRNVIDLCEEDEALIKTHLGEFALYEGESVPLDLPMMNEELQMPTQDEVDKFFERTYNETHYLNSKPVAGQKGTFNKMEVEPWDEYDLSNWNSLVRKAKSKGQLNEGKAIITFKNDYEVKMNTGEGYDDDFEYFEAGEREQVYILDKNDKRVHVEFGDGTNAFIPLDVISVQEKSLDEAEFKGKDVPLNKPKRGGSKAYYVYVRDPKTKKIKKVSFGSGGLRAKIKNKEARNAFAARHNCKNKKDRTKAGYWSCNLPRYASALGLGANMNTFW